MLIGALKLAASAASTAGSAALQANDSFDSMIDRLKSSENITINRIGRVIEGTKFGFLLGYVTPSILTAAGVCLTTGDLSLAVAGGIEAFTNPVSGVCAAVGAVYFGWQALSESERDAVLQQVSQFLKVGFEMIKSVIRFALKLMKDLLSADNIAELKKTVSDAVELVGGHIADITRSVKDKVSKVAGTVSAVASAAGETVSKTASSAGETVSKTASAAGETVSKGAKSASDTVSAGASAVGGAASTVAGSIAGKFKKDNEPENND